MFIDSLILSPIYIAENYIYGKIYICSIDDILYIYTFLFIIIITKWVRIMTRLKNLLFITIFSILAISTTGCSSADGPNETMGTVLGGIGGGLLGSQFGSGSGQTAATIAGATVGAMVGKSVGKNMDKVDNLNLNNALQNQSDNKSTTWVNPKTNVRYTVTPTSTDNEGDQYCRDYKINKIINGESKTVTERACRVNGRWVKQ